MRMFICDISDDGIQGFKKHSLIGQVSMDKFGMKKFENETEAVIGFFHERNVVQL